MWVLILIFLKICVHIYSKNKISKKWSLKRNILFFIQPEELQVAKNVIIDYIQPLLEDNKDDSNWKVINTLYSYHLFT